MKVSKQIGIISVAAALAVPAAAVAGNGHGNGPHGATGNTGATGATGSHAKGRCRKPTVAKAFVVSGTYGATGAFTATKNSDGTYSGTISFTVAHANHHGKGATPPFSFTNAKVTFDSASATAPAAGDDVRAIGKIAVLKHGCTSTAAGTVTIRRIVFSAPGS